MRKYNPILVNPSTVCILKDQEQYALKEMFTDYLHKNKILKENMSSAQWEKTIEPKFNEMVINFLKVIGREVPDDAPEIVNYLQNTVKKEIKNKVIKN